MKPKKRGVKRKKLLHGQFTDRQFVDGQVTYKQFEDRIVRRQESSPIGHFADRTVRRHDGSPSGNFADSVVRRHNRTTHKGSNKHNKEP